MLGRSKAVALEDRAEFGSLIKVSVRFTHRFNGEPGYSCKEYDYLYDGLQTIKEGSLVVVPVLDQTEDNFNIARVVRVSRPARSIEGLKYIVEPIDSKSWRARSTHRARRDMLLKTISEKVASLGVIEQAKRVAHLDPELQHLIEQYEAI